MTPIKLEARLAQIPQREKAGDRLSDPRAAAAHVARMLSRVSETLAAPEMTVSEKRWLLESVVLCAVPVDGGAGVAVTLRPGVPSAGAADRTGSTQAPGSSPGGLRTHRGR